jgi:hypothetical protein
MPETNDATPEPCRECGKSPCAYCHACGGEYGRSGPYACVCGDDYECCVDGTCYDCLRAAGLADEY